MIKSRARLLLATGLPLCMVLSACGGGGGGVRSTPIPPSAPTPPIVVPTPPPPPAPPPPPPPSGFNTPEFQRSEGIAHARAVTAYQAGATGAGITAAIIDSGLSTSTAEFAGRISPASQDVASNRGIGDIGGHGTAVTAVLAAARNNANIVGIAFDATILALRTDEPGTCADTSEDGGCSHLTSDIARAIDIAVHNNARVINISLGGGSATRDVRDAVARAAQAGVVIVISAGNEGDTPEGANPDLLAQVALTSGANGHVIIAGSVGPNDQISEFSNRAGVGQAVYLSALGERVRSFDHNGQAFLYSGTSFSTPQVSGAVALLAQAFPNLTGKQIVQLLFTSARDGGAAGDDVIYGQGILDLAEAFRPQGQTVVAGSQAPVSMTGNAVLSEPMGDAAQAGMGAIVLDGFDRAFALDLAATVRRMPAPRHLVHALAPRGGGQAVTAAGRDAMIAVSIDAGSRSANLARLALRGEDAEAARVAAGIAAARIDRDTSIAFGFSQSGDSVGAQLSGRTRPAFLVADSVFGRRGFASAPAISFALRHRVGETGLTLFGESGDALSRPEDGRQRLDEPDRRTGYSIAGLAADRRFGRLRIDASASYIGEDETILGARFANGFGNPGSRSIFADFGARYDAGRGWTFAADARHGWTIADATAGLIDGGTIRSFALSADASREGIFGADDRLSLRIAQPLRVYAGGLDLTLPTSYDYATLNPDYSAAFFNLAPDGREIDAEAAYGRALWGGWLSGNFFYRRDPGHIAATPDDYGAAMRFSLGF